MHSQQPPGVVQNWSTLQCSKQNTEQCGYDHAPVTRGRMRAQFPLPHGPWEGEEEETQRERGPQSERLETNRRCGRVVGASRPRRPDSQSTFKSHPEWRMRIYSWHQTGLRCSAARQNIELSVMMTMCL